MPPAMETPRAHASVQASPPPIAISAPSITGEDFCPLEVPRTTAIASSTGNGFAVDVTSDDDKSVLEIIKWARALGPIGRALEK